MSASGPTFGTKWAEVEIDVLRDNAAALCTFVGADCAVMAMVKANGYGHGAVHAATAAIAGGATWLGVSSIVEAVELRRSGITAAILNIGWTSPAEMRAAVADDVDIAVFDPEGVSAARDAARDAGQRIRVHWKIDTGMGRLGTPPAAIASVGEALMAARGHVDVVALFTHFATADETSTAFSLDQHERFLQVTADLRASFPTALLHCANSAALLRMPETHHDIVRPGIALYGYPPEHCAGIVKVRPALQMRAVVTQVKDIDEGSSVGYGRAWFASRRSRVATVAAGYADGVDRRNSNRGRVILGGAVCPMVGRVSMDQLSVDITDAGEVRPGDAATLIGRGGDHGIDAQAVADAIGTIPNEVLCAVSARVPRVAVPMEAGLR